VEYRLMALRIRKEVQEKLKASLDGAPEAVSAPVSSTPSATSQPIEETSVSFEVKSKKPRKTAARKSAAARKALNIRKASKLNSIKTAESKEVPKGRAKKTNTVKAKAIKARKSTKRSRKNAVALFDFAGEIETIRALFDVLIVHASDPDNLKALRSLTERYLSDKPDREKLDRVRSLLQRQAAIIRKEREGVVASKTNMVIDVVALPAPKRESSEKVDAKPLKTEINPESKTAVDSPLPVEAKRRTLLSWLRRKGSSAPAKGGGSGGGEGSGPVDPTVSKNPIKARIKTALMACIWAGVGLSTLTYASSLLYVNYMRLEIDTALISGNVEPINAPFDGSVTSMLVKVGDRLIEGSRFMVLEDPEVEKLTKLAAVKVDRAREDLVLRQAELESEKAKRDEYVSISKNKMEKIESDLESIQKLEQVARERFERVSDLFKKGIMIRPRLEEASDRLAELTSQLNKARINKKERAQQFESVLAGHFYDGAQVVGRMKEAEAAVQRASAEVDFSIEELQVMQQRRQINKITANHEARILKVLRQEGSSVKRGDTMLVVERMDERMVHAFVRQDEANRVAIGDEAVVYVPALRAKATARVSAVERNAAFLDDIDARYSWKLARDGGPKPTDKDRTARITLKFDGADKDVVDSKFEIGMPTVVSFQRRSTNTTFSNFADIGRKL
jgi:multidrug resistance efflux pump